MYAFDSFLVRVPLSFSRTCVFAFKFGGMICPTSAYSGIPILLILLFSSVHTLGQCMIQVWGYGKTKHGPLLMLCHSKAYG